MTKSDPKALAPRPVNLVTILAIFASFAVFLVLVLWVYRPQPAALPFNVVPQNLAKDQADIATPEARAAYLEKLRAGQEQQLHSYAWKDPHKRDVVRIPIERAMELIVKEHGS